MDTIRLGILETRLNVAGMSYSGIEVRRKRSKKPSGKKPWRNIFAIAVLVIPQNFNKCEYHASSIGPSISNSLHQPSIFIIHFIASPPRLLVLFMLVNCIFSRRNSPRLYQSISKMTSVASAMSVNAPSPQQSNPLNIKVIQNKHLYVSEPNPSWFGNGPNPSSDPAWTVRIEKGGVPSTNRHALSHFSLLLP
jgi:hypothetical protein